MRHAGVDGLNELDGVLSAVRVHASLTERKRGTFYRKSSAFLHFHEDPAGLFADLKVGSDWERFRVCTPEERSVMLARVETVLGGQSPT
jgi:hypothetical protein